MLGLLGGLLGRGIARSFGARPLAGLLAGRVMRNAASGGRGVGTMMQGRAPEQAPQEEQPVEAEQPQAANQAPAAAGAPVEQGTLPAVQSAQAATKVTENLLEPPPPVQAPPPQAEEKVAPPAQVANKTETTAPVAQVQDQQFPAVPETPLSGLVDRLGEAPPPRNIVFEDPVPLKPVDVKSQAQHTGNRPEMSFGLATTANAYTPRYYFRGR